MAHPVHPHSCVLVVAADAAPLLIPVADSDEVFIVRWPAIIGLTALGLLFVGRFDHFAKIVLFCLVGDGDDLVVPVAVGVCVAVGICIVVVDRIVVVICIAVIAWVIVAVCIVARPAVFIRVCLGIIGISAYPVVVVGGHLRVVGPAEVIGGGGVDLSPQRRGLVALDGGRPVLFLLRLGRDIVDGSVLDAFHRHLLPVDDPAISLDLLVVLRVENELLRSLFVHLWGREIVWHVRFRFLSCFLGR